MAKTIKHKSMNLTQQEHSDLHKKQDIPAAVSKSPQQAVNPFAVGGGFLAYCVKKGWLIQKGKGRTAKYYLTGEGKKELKKFDINIQTD